MEIIAGGIAPVKEIELNDEVAGTVKFTGCGYAVLVVVGYGVFDLAGQGAVGYCRDTVMLIIGVIGGVDGKAVAPLVGYLLAQQVGMVGFMIFLTTQNQAC